jgi:hypothetical protein
MSIKEVEETLDNEVELLQATVEFVRNYPNDKFTGSGKFIQESWAIFLTQRSDTNQNVAGAGTKQPVGIEIDMEAERTQLEAYIAASDYEPVYSEEWREFFECEKRILEHLLGMIKKP